MIVSKICDGINTIAGPVQVGVSPQPTPVRLTDTLEQPVQESKYCINCGASIPRQAKFCPNCGFAQPAAEVPVKMPIHEAKEQAIPAAPEEVIETEKEMGDGDMGKPNIEKLAENGDVEGLVKALKYKKDAVVRFSAAIGLGIFGDERAVEPLIMALGDIDNDVRKNATESLGRLGEIAVKPLIKALKHSDMFVRGQAANALGLIGDKTALKSLKKLVNEDEEFIVKVMAKTAILMIRERSQ